MMFRVGIDFDNTIVNYDGVFHKAAVEAGWMPDTVEPGKQAVKQYFIDRDEEPRWTELQGKVYGKAIKHAKPYAGLVNALLRMQTNNVLLFIVSHKTRYPIIGEKLDFHGAAREWLAVNGIEQLIRQTYFCPEKEEKIQQITDLQLDWFIDDLPSILKHPQFPENTRGILFDPDCHYQSDPLAFAHRSVNQWSEIPRIVEGEAV